MKRAMIEVSGQLFAQWLQIEGMDILMAQWDFQRGVLAIVVHHNALPDVPDGLFAETIQPTYRIDTCGHVCELGEHRKVTRDEDIHAYGTLLHVPLGTTGDKLL